jgi:GMP reductase
MKIDNDFKLDFDDVLLVPQRSKAASRKDVELKRTFKFYHSDRKWFGVPLMAANMDTTGTFNMGTSLATHECVTCLHKHHDYDDIINYYKSQDLKNNVWISIGMEKHATELIKTMAHTLGYVPNICIDVANGYTEKFVHWCANIRKEASNWSQPIIMAGNVCTPEMVSELILHGGVDIVKVGIGPGSACTTRLKAGVGYGQLSAIAECAHAAHGLRSDAGRLGLICADGGCRYPADVAKAYAAGADFVMLGGMLAGTEECEGQWVYDNKNEDGQIAKPHEKLQKKSLIFYGMSSKLAQEKYNGGMCDYKSSEGRVKKVPYKGPVKTTIEDILGGVRSACSYTGAINLKDFSKTAKFIRVNRVHDNYSVEEL